MTDKNTTKLKTQEHDALHLWLYNKENQSRLLRHVVSTAGLKESWFGNIRIVEYGSDQEGNRNRVVIADKGWIEEKMEAYVQSQYGKDARFVTKTFPAKVEYSIVDVTPQSIEREVPIYGGYNNNYLINVIDCILVGEVITIGQIDLTDWSIFNHAWIWNIEKTRETDNHLLLCEFKPKLYSISSLMGQIHIYLDRVKKMPKYDRYTIHPTVITLDDTTQYDEMLKSEGITVFRPILKE